MGKNFKNRHVTIADCSNAVAVFYKISADFDTDRGNKTTILQQFFKLLYDSVIQQLENCRYCWSCITTSYNEISYCHKKGVYGDTISHINVIDQGVTRKCFP